VSGGPAPRPRRRLRRRRLGRALGELHVQLRTEGDTPARKALSVALGSAVACVPVPGTHLPLSAALAHLFGLSRVRTYLAAHLSNPLTYPFLTWAEVAVGRRLTTGRWPGLRLGLHQADWTFAGTWAAFGRDLAVGAAALALVFGAALGLAAWWVGLRWRRPPLLPRLDEEASRRYLDTGIGHWEWVRGKLRHDPVYHAVLASGALPEGGRIVDLGCGRGPLLALLAAARDHHRAGLWPAGRPPPPAAAELVGIELRPRLAAVARRALAGEATVRRADLAAYDPPLCRAAVLLDVLHYLGAADQEALLARVAARLEPGGVLLVREADAGRGARYLATRAGERLAALARGHLRQRFHYRSAAEWTRLLAGHGLAVEGRPMWAGTPFGNVLLAARKPDRRGG
jgi:uncharacterized protein (DUF2062 family)/trans-aconitate methyltransferase